MQVIDQINGSALFAQSAYSASVATKDNLDRDITATYLTAHQPLDGYATEDWVTAQGYITGVDLSPYYTTADANTLSSMLSGAIDYVSANAGDDFPQSADEAIQTYQQNSGTYLTSHQDISYKLDTSSFTAWSAAQAENDYQLSAGTGIDLVDDDINKITRIDVTGDFGNPEVESYVQNTSSTIDEVNTSYQTNSSTFLTAHQSLEGLMSANLLEFNAENNISAYGGSAFEDCAPTLPMTGRDGVDVQLDNGSLILSSTLWETVTTNSAQWSQGGAGDADVNNYVYNNSASINETVTSYEQNSASYLTAIPTGYAVESAFEKNANDKITAYNGTAFFAGGEGGGDMFTAYLEYNDQNQISGYAGSALAGGGDVPEDVMVETNLEYNAVNEISAYNGSAIAQYGAEKQWLQHDDTIVSISNSAQYAFGCNISALQRLMGIDETVLWSGTPTSSISLSEPFSNFESIKIDAYAKEQLSTRAITFEFPGTNTEFDFHILGYNSNAETIIRYLTRYKIVGTVFSATAINHWWQAVASVTAGTWGGRGTNSPILPIKVIGVHRISG